MSVALLKDAATAFNAANTEVLGQAFAPELQRQIAATLRESRAAFPDLNYQVEDVVEKGSQIAFTYTVTGTQKGALAGYPASNKQAKWTGSGIAAVANNKITQIQVFEDHLRKLIQLGIDWTHFFPANNATGTWVGSAQGTTVTLHLTQTGNSVSGNATVAGLPQIPVTGTMSDPKITLNGNLNGLNIDFSGTFADANTINGTVTALGNSLQVTLNRS
jgi:predicted ester cyclase